jgi:type I restriction enzyme S subunit
VTRIEELFSRLDAGVAELKKAKAQLQRYRQSVLKAAVEGRLTEEWRKEHPDVKQTEVLMSSFKWTQEKEKAGQRSGESQLLNVSDLATIPNSWEWARAGQISDFITKGTTPKSEKLLNGSGDIPFIKVYNLTFDGTLDFSINPTFISWDTHVKDLARSLVLPNDVLINIVGPPLGKVSIVPDHYLQWNINQAIARFRPRGGYDPDFLCIVLQTEKILKWAKMRSKATAGQFNLTLEICRDLPIPVPSVAEQKEIVAKVKRHISEAEVFKTEMEANLKRTILLRQSILKGAFEGKLVPQNPNDEPASVLLERIRAERSNGSIRRRGSRIKRNNTQQMRLIQ